MISSTTIDMADSLYHCPDKKKIQQLQDLSNKLRILSIKSTNAAGSGFVSFVCVKPFDVFWSYEIVSVSNYVQMLIIKPKN